MDDTVLITGVAGFLGSNLAHALLSSGRRVIGLDNLLTGSERNVEWLSEQEQFQFITHDIREPLPNLSHESIKEIYNLACPASPVWYEQHARLTLETCSIGVENVLTLARQSGARILHTSTSEVYGEPLEHPQRESYFGNVNSYGPRAMYDEGKRYAEARLWVARHQEGIDTAIVRLFNTYGPRMHPKDGRVVSAFILAALDGQPIPIHGDGEQTRSYCYVSDTVRGLIKMMESEAEGPINLGNPKEFTVRELADLVGALTGKTITFQKLPARPDDPSRRKPDISRAKELLNWQPTVDLHDGLKQTIAYFSTPNEPALEPADSELVTESSS